MLQVRGGCCRAGPGALKVTPRSPAWLGQVEGGPRGVGVWGQGALLCLEGGVCKAKAEMSFPKLQTWRKVGAVFGECPHDPHWASPGV